MRGSLGKVIGPTYAKTVLGCQEINEKPLSKKRNYSHI